MKWLTLTLCFLFTSLSADGDKHAFHASISSVVYNPRSAHLEVTIKLFTEDLESALKKRYHKDFYLENGTGGPADSIEKYILQQFKVEQCYKNPQTQFIGYETEYDLTFVYLEISGAQFNPSFSITNTTFFELFDDQSNIVTIDWNNQRKSAFLKPGKPNETLQFSQHE